MSEAGRMRRFRRAHTEASWTRELWLESLGLPAMLPPPEEKRRVGDAVTAARVEEQRTAH